MAVKVIPNQTLKLIENGETINEKNARLMWDRREYCQLVKTSQVQQYQVRVTEDSGNNLIGNGEFTTNLNTWTTYPVNSFIHQPAGVASSFPFLGLPPDMNCAIFQDFFAPMKTLKLSFDVKFLGVGTNTIQAFMSVPAVAIGGQSLVSSDDVSFNINYTYTSYWRINAAGTYTVTFSATHTDLGGGMYLDNVRLVELSDPVLTLEDCNGNYIKDLNIFERFEDYVTVTHSWDGLTDGQCYRICVYGLEDLALDYLGDALCIIDGKGNPVIGSNGECVKAFG